MKKISLLLILLLLAVFVCSCNFLPDPDTGSSDNSSTSSSSSNSSSSSTVHDGDLQEVCKTLNEMAALNYKNIKVEVNVTNAGTTLKSAYDFSFDGAKTTVTFSYQRVNKIQTVDGQIVVPSKYISTYSGSQVVENGKVISSSGDPINIQVSSYSALNLHFSAENFNSAEYEEGSFNAVVLNPESFAGIKSNCSDMTVNVSYGSCFENLILNYNDGENAVSIDYSFVR